MPEPLGTFLHLRDRLQDVRHESGWIFGNVEFAPDEEGLRSDLDLLWDNGVISEIHQNGALVFTNNLEAGPVSLKFDSGKLCGYFETYDLIVSKHPVDPPTPFIIWEKDEELAAGCLAAWTFLNFLRDRVEVWDETQRRFFLVDQHAIEIPLQYPAISTVGLVPIVPRIERFLNVNTWTPTRAGYFFGRLHPGFFVMYPWRSGSAASSKTCSLYLDELSRTTRFI